MKNQKKVMTPFGKKVMTPFGVMENHSYKAKDKNITWIPAIDEPAESVTDHGWLDLDGEIWEITNWHSFDDFGTTLETLTIERLDETKEVYSYDEGETFVLDIN